MKKYKLIKEYPGSPELGAIISKHNHRIDLHEYTTEDNRYVVYMPNDYPEFWEEIIEKSLLTTEDGVDIFEKDKVFIVHKNYLHFTNSGNTCLCNPNFKINTNSLYFSKREAAEEHILMNKPCLSIKDVLDSCSSESTFVLVDNLKKLIKSKSNGEFQ